MLRLVKAPCVDMAVAETSFTAVCPIDGSIDSYTVTIRYRPRAEGDGCIYAELSSLRELLDGYRGRRILHEELLSDLVNILARSLRPRELHVELRSMYRGITYTLTTAWREVEGIVI